MRSNRTRTQRRTSASRYTHLSACVQEEGGCFTVQIRLYNEEKPDRGVWGEEVAESLEVVSEMLEAVAEQYSIPQAQIKIRLRMDNAKEGTRH